MVTSAPQSTLHLRRLPAFLQCIALLLFLPLSLRAQASSRVNRETSFRKAPGEVVLGTLLSGTSVSVGETRGDWASVSLAGFIWTRSIHDARRDGFDAVVSADRENLRGAPNGPILARVVKGTLLKTTGSPSGGWVAVQRDVWIPRSALGGAAPAQTAQPDDSTPPAASVTAAPGAAAADQVTVAGATAMYRAPGGDSAGTLAPGMQARVVARSGDWTRVQLETWVRSGDLRAAEDSTALHGVSAAEVRAAPSRYVGRTVDWRVQFLAVQRADELRPEIPAGQPYLLTRGPLPESGFVYVMIPEDQVERFQRMQPLQELNLRGIIRSATTRYLPNPVVELVSLLPDDRS